MSPEHSRRRVLAQSGVLAAALAGCMSLPRESGSSNSTPSTSGSGGDTTSTEWRMYAHDARNTNRSPVSVPDSVAEQWRSPVPATKTVFVEGTIYGLQPNGVDAVGSASSDVTWQRGPDAGTLTGTLAVGGDTLYHGYAPPEDAGDDGEHAVVAREVATGERSWAEPVSGHVGAVTVTEDVVLAASSPAPPDELAIETGYVTALDPATGDQRWQQETAKACGSPVASDGETVIAVPAGGAVHAYEAASGDLQWSRFTDFRQSNQPPIAPILTDDTVFVLRRAEDAGTGLHVYALDRADGSTRWSYSTNGRATPGSPDARLALTDEYVLVHTSADLYETRAHLDCIDRAAGKRQWRYDTPKRNWVQPVVADETVLVTVDNAVAAVSLEGEERWRHTFEDGQITFVRPIVGNDQIYVPVSTEEESALVALG